MRLSRWLYQLIGQEYAGVHFAIGLAWTGADGVKDLAFLGAHGWG